MKPSIRTYLCNDENHRFFGEGPRQLLHAIDETGSLRSAALSMNMAYTKALRIIRSAEATLGFPLTVRTTGGKGGGGGAGSGGSLGGNGGNGFVILRFYS